MEIGNDEDKLHASASSLTEEAALTKREHVMILIYHSARPQAILQPALVRS